MADQTVAWDLPTIQSKFKRSYKIAAPQADAENGQPAIDARAAADMQLVLHTNAQRTGDTSSLDNRTDADLDAIGEAEGVPRPPAVGSTGYLVIEAATGGTTIFAGDEVKPKNGSVRFQCSVTALYADGASVLVVAIDVGPGTNLGADTEMEWSNPRSGCIPGCAVWDEGLTGGRDRADNDEYKALIIERRGNPAVAGNDAAYQAVIEDPFAHGVAVQKAFTNPAIKGPGTTGATFTVRPETPGGSRVPSTAQLAIVGAAVEGSMPGDDGVFMYALVDQSVEIQLRASWRKAAAGWADQVPWPEYIASNAVRVDNAVTIAAAGFRVTTDGTTEAPLVGQSIGAFNLVSVVEGETRPGFERKTIDTVTEVVANKSWDLTFDMDAGASSLFVPEDGALVSPWSDSLNLVTPPIVDYFDHTGPGEMVATFYDPGRRQRRQPENPEEWPSVITNRIDSLVQDVVAVRSATLVAPASTLSMSVGVPGVLAYLPRLTDLAVYAETT